VGGGRANRGGRVFKLWRRTGEDWGRYPLLRPRMGEEGKKETRKQRKRERFGGGGLQDFLQR